MGKLFAAAAVAAFLMMAFGCVSQIGGSTTLPHACTAEAKICPGGSAVGRTGQNCDFAPCPQANHTLYGRISIGPLCPTEPCSRIFDYSVARVNVYDAAGKNRIATVSADSGGYYWADIGQGNYLVNVTDASGNSFGIPRIGYTVPVSIENGSKVEMDFNIDTGIR